MARRGLAKHHGLCWGNCPACRSAPRNVWMPLQHWTVDHRARLYELVECERCRAVWVLHEQFQPF